ncbi:MAG: TIGR03032 family protein [Methyloligellaceae bacterium]
MAKTKKPAAKKPAAKKPAARKKAEQAETSEEVKFEIATSRQFESWLGEQNINIAFTTYQAGKLFFLGLNEEGKLSVFNRTLERCMGLAYGANNLWVAGLYQIYKFVDAIEERKAEGAYDSLFVPQASSFTGDVDTHDMAVGRDGTLYFVNTLFSCIATLTDTHSFKPFWQPGFIDRLAAEDRCHLNGLALNNGVPVLATAVAETNVADGWRDHRTEGGIVIDVKSGKSVVQGLSMPHSPRIHQNKLWLHNSGTGHFGYADLKSGAFTPLTFCPGYLRGLAFVNDFAIVGLSKPRENRTFSGLELDDNLTKEKVEARCGVYIIDLKSGDVAHWVRIEGIVSELYDVATLPDRRNAAAIGFRSDEIRRVISIES